MTNNTDSKAPSHLPDVIYMDDHGLTYEGEDLDDCDVERRFIAEDAITVQQAAKVLLETPQELWKIAVRIVNSTDATSQGAVDLSLMHALKALSEPDQ